MKSIAIAIALSCVSISAVATATPADISGVLDISGNVQDAYSGCTVTLERSYMRLDTQDIKDLPMQGHYKDTVSGNYNSVRVTGDSCEDNTGSSIAIRFTGTADNSDGTSFINTSSGSAGALGIGVEVYGYGKNIITPNVSQLLTYNGQYPFYVGMVKLKNTTPTGGFVESSVTVEVDRL